jgi:hypothetical protein
VETVLTRSNILRDYLKAGGTLICATAENNTNVPGMEFFNALQKQYPKTLLSPNLKGINTLEHLHSGATYRIAMENEITIFSLNASQATSPSNSWGMWCGSLEKKPVKDRFDFIINFLNQHGVTMNAANTTLASTKEPAPTR